MDGGGSSTSAACEPGVSSAVLRAEVLALREDVREAAALLRAARKRMPEDWRRLADSWERRVGGGMERRMA